MKDDRRVIRVVVSAALAVLCIGGCSSDRAYRSDAVWGAMLDQPIEMPCLAGEYGVFPVCSALGIGDFRINTLPEDAHWALRIVFLPSYSEELVFTIIGFVDRGTIEIVSPTDSIWSYCRSKRAPVAHTGADSAEVEQELPLRRLRARAEFSGESWSAFVAELQAIQPDKQQTIGCSRFDGSAIHVFHRDRQNVNYFQHCSDAEGSVLRRLAACLCDVTTRYFGNDVAAWALDGLRWSLEVDREINAE